MKILLYSLACALNTLSLCAQDFPVPLPSSSPDITSDYSPRWRSSRYDFHEGIDYRANRGTSVLPVESGVVVDVIILGTIGAKYITIKGQHGYWIYRHIFPDSLTREGDWEIIANASMDSASSHHLSNVIILWSNRALRRAIKVICKDNGWQIRASIDGGSIESIRDVNGDVVVSSNTVVRNGNSEPIGPVGSSGSKKSVHLHVELKDTLSTSINVNPLYYINHNYNIPQFDLRFLDIHSVNNIPNNGDTIYYLSGIDSTSQYHERARVYINSVCGADVDKVKLYLFEPTEPRVYDDHHCLKKIIYGGLPPFDAVGNSIFESSMMPSYMVTSIYGKGSYRKTGMSPKQTLGPPNDPDCGLDTAYFIGLKTKQQSSSNDIAVINHQAKYKDGRYVMVAEATSITQDPNYHLFYSADKNVIFDNFAPYVQSLRIAQGGIEPIYEKTWPNYPISPEELALPLPTHGDSLARQNAAVLTITFSEAMNSAQAPGITFKPQSGGNDIQIAFLNTGIEPV